ncbi:OV-16 antigen [Armadillidium nasatum]|uniref:OV-16 antigen n=1 Tax=Armadillidium nasatum TaxID=96803 RepID=A0A5N5TM23_9CRUS|nr:OV-16 antigen [Armadillidium nasatum]
MEQHQVVPDVIDSVPSKVVNVSYNGAKVDLGNELTPTQVKDVPEISWEADDASYYTLIMTEEYFLKIPMPPSRKDPQYREILHWLVINIPGSDLNKGETLTPYRGSGPPKGTGIYELSIYILQY